MTLSLLLLWVELTWNDFYECNERIYWVNWNAAVDVNTDRVNWIVFMARYNRNVIEKFSCSQMYCTDNLLYSLLASRLLILKWFYSSIQECYFVKEYLHFTNLFNKFILEFFVRYLEWR